MDNILPELAYVIAENVDASDLYNLIKSNVIQRSIRRQFLGVALRSIISKAQPAQKTNHHFCCILANLFQLYLMLLRCNFYWNPDQDFEGGWCYLTELKDFLWVQLSVDLIGQFPQPWLIAVLYGSHNHEYSEVLTFRSDTAQMEARRIVKKQGFCVNHGFTTNNLCFECLFHRSWKLDWEKTDRTKLRETILLRDDCDGLYHFCGYTHHKSLNYQAELSHRDKFGAGTYHTLHWLRQKNDYLSGRIGTPERVVLDYSTVVSPKAQTREPEEAVMSDSENTREEHSTIFPNDSASCITPRPLKSRQVNQQQSCVQEAESVVSALSSQIARLTADVENLALRKLSRIGDYNKSEYDSDLEDAFLSSGILVKDGQNFLPPMPFTSASDLVPQMTIDKRLNFLIRLHTAIFKVIPNSADYPRPGILRDLRRIYDGSLPDDHPSFDLLQIVVTDTFDWQHYIVKNNNFMLPALEPGMPINERIIAVSMISLKTEYFARWNSLMKDCILPTDITDTSRWSDSHPARNNKVTSRRPDMAVKHRDDERRSYRKHRRDSLF